jgi:hypothetical protein
MALVARSYRWALAAIGLLVAIPTLMIWRTTNTVIFHRNLTHSSPGIYRWNGIDLQPQLLEAAWWVAFVLLGVALFGRWSRGALVRIGALFIVFTFVFVFLPGPPFHGPPSSGPVIGPLESPSP